MLTPRKPVIETHRVLVAKHIKEQSRRMSEKRRELENKRNAERPIVIDEEKREKNVLKT